ncbi:unnamed protein product, partial [Discosporangium mesarthrocarpum]
MTSSQSLMDFQRNPADPSEVRLLYHRISAPAEGLLGFLGEGGDRVSFDFAFTEVNGMNADQVKALVQV